MFWSKFHGVARREYCITTNSGVCVCQLVSKRWQSKASAMRRGIAVMARAIGLMDYCITVVETTVRPNEIT